jgi:hypothetical protein
VKSEGELKGEKWNGNVMIAQYMSTVWGLQSCTATMTMRKKVIDGNRAFTTLNVLYSDQARAPRR